MVTTGDGLGHIERAEINVQRDRTQSIEYSIEHRHRKAFYSSSLDGQVEQYPK